MVVRFYPGTQSNPIILTFGFFLVILYLRTPKSDASSLIAECGEKGTEMSSRGLQLFSLAALVLAVGIIALLWYASNKPPAAEVQAQVQTQEQVTLQVVKLASAKDGSYVFTMWSVNNRICVVVDGAYGVGMNCDWDTRYFPEAP